MFVVCYLLLLALIVCRLQQCATTADEGFCSHMCGVLLLLLAEPPDPYRSIGKTKSL